MDSSQRFRHLCPLGPWIETELNTTDLAITSYVGSELRQSGNTKDLIFNVAQIVSFVSACMTLLPGDVILTGTPSGVGPLVPGDQVDVEIEGIGNLINYVSAGE